jgi:hypothetical protein
VRLQFLAHHQRSAVERFGRRFLWAQLHSHDCAAVNFYDRLCHPLKQELWLSDFAHPTCNAVGNKLSRHSTMDAILHKLSSAICMAACKGSKKTHKYVTYAFYVLFILRACQAFMVLVHCWTCKPVTCSLPKVLRLNTTTGPQSYCLMGSHVQVCALLCLVDSTLIIVQTSYGWASAH